MADIRVGVEEIVRHFHELEDPRSTINQKHPFVSVVVIAIMAVMAGANGPTSIAKWAEAQRGVSDRRSRVAQRRAPQGCLSPRAVVAQPGGVSSVLRQLADGVAGRGGRSDRHRAADPGRGRQDGAAQPRPQERPGRLALGQRLGQRVRPVAGARSPVPRNRTKSRRFPSFCGSWTSKAPSSPSTRWGRKKRSPPKSSTEGGLCVGAQRQPGDVAQRGHRLHRPTDRERLRRHRRSPAHDERDGSWPRRDAPLHSHAGADRPWRTWNCGKD